MAKNYEQIIPLLQFAQAFDLVSGEVGKTRDLLYG